MNCSSKKGLRRDVSQSTTAFQEIIFPFGNEGLEFNIKRENKAKICRNGLPAVFEATYRMSSRDGDLDDFLSHENQGSPLSLSDCGELGQVADVP